MLEQKMSLIKKRDMDGNLIFSSPCEDTLYTLDELKSMLKPIKGKKIPNNLTIVQRKHWVTDQILEILGYTQPDGYRTLIARQHKPKFFHQLLDIFVQKHSNLQVWNYLPYSEERKKCRYLILKVNDNQIINFIIKTGAELQDWDTTGTKTIKWQAVISDSIRKNAKNTILCAYGDPIFEKNRIIKEDIEPLSKKLEKIKNLQKNTLNLINTSPDPYLLYTIKELSDLLILLLNTKVHFASERIIGQKFQQLIAHQLGYTILDLNTFDTGNYPDIIHQIIEIKLQFSPTIDLGYHLPISKESIDIVWNTGNITPRDIRYIIGLLDKTEDYFEIKGIIITAGENFENFFSICEGTNFKVQMIIPDFNNL